MNCPSPIADILLNIIQIGILRIRAAAWSGSADQAAVEADHIHNLPAILKDFSADALKYYWEIERPSFMSKTSDLGAFEDSWKKLHAFARSAGKPMTVS